MKIKHFIDFSDNLAQDNNFALIGNINMLNWAQLLNGLRRKDIHGQGSQTLSANGRIELERDYDRILFATPTRRMADKTQVFPLERNDSVRNRLTHSHEVSSLARSIGIRLAFDFREQVFSQHASRELERCVPALLAAIGLAHDLGNPLLDIKAKSPSKIGLSATKKTFLALSIIPTQKILLTLTVTLKPLGWSHAYRF